jgi:hypothetical protein
VGPATPGAFDEDIMKNTSRKNAAADRRSMKRVPRPAWLAACLFASGLLAPGAAFAQGAHAFEWNPRSGDAWIDRQLADINTYGSRYRGAFIDEVVRYHAAPRDLVTELVGTRNWSPGDVYYACAVAQMVGRPCRALVDAWGQSHGEGWKAVAGQAGIAGHRDAIARLKQDITASYARWGRPLAEPEAQAAVPKKPGPASAGKPVRGKKPAKPGT